MASMVTTVGTFGREALSAGGPDPGRGPGDHRDGAVQSSHVRFPWCRADPRGPAPGTQRTAKLYGRSRSG